MLSGTRIALLTIGLISSNLGQSLAQGPQVSSPTGSIRTIAANTRSYPWHQQITATIFWIGEAPTQNNPTPNYASSWDTQWQASYGGYDNPDPAARSADFTPKAFTPKQNPFYVALPYNDRVDHRMHKIEASRVIPWWRDVNPDTGETALKGRWIQIHFNGRSCFAQWEDCGPFNTTDWQYVFGNKRPKNTKNNGAGIDLSPAVRDYLQLKSSDKVNWRFCEFVNVPKGPWAVYGNNNPFVNSALDPRRITQQKLEEYIRKARKP